MDKLAALAAYAQAFRAKATQLHTYRHARLWMETGIDAEAAAGWANAGYQPDEAKPLIDQGLTPDLASAGDTPGKTWWLAIENDRVVGFAAAIEQAQPGETHLMTFWVRPDQRDKGVGRQLYDARLNLHRPERPAFRGWCSISSRPLYLASGFVEVGHGVHDGHEWWEMHRQPCDPVPGSAECATTRAGRGNPMSATATPETIEDPTGTDEHGTVRHFVCMCRPQVALCGMRRGGGEGGACVAVRRTLCETCVGLYRRDVPCPFCGCRRTQPCPACRAVALDRPA